MNNLPKKIPIFPLRGVIFFPETNLPLNIFEDRYLKMINNILKNDKYLGMIQSKKIDGEVYQIGCLGKIDEHDRTSDGRILINLKGITRFKINQEIENNQPYREFLVNYDLFKDDLQSFTLLRFLIPELSDSKSPIMIIDPDIFAIKN